MGIAVQFIVRLVLFVIDLIRLGLQEIEDLGFRLQYGNIGGLDRRSRREVLTTMKRLRALRKQGLYVYGASNRLRVKGSPLNVAITQGGATAGSPAIAGGGIAGTSGLCGVVESAKDANNNAVLHMEGVWSLAFTVVGALAVGDPIYMIQASGVLTQTAAGNRLFGYSLTVAGAGATTISVKLAGSN
jgi:predicted RecA/RadA family phage recombinase